MKICLSEAMADTIGDRVRALAPESEVVVLQADGAASADLADTSVFCFSVDLSQHEGSMQAAWDLLQQPSLAWVQSPGAGIELPIWTELLQRGVRLTTAAGIHAEPVAQYVFTQVLHWHRHVAEHQRRQTERRWDPIMSDDLTTKTIGIVGYGGIGRSVARIGASFGMHVIGLSRTEVDDPSLSEWKPPSQLHALLESSDFVVLALPMTAETHHLIGEHELAAMKDDAVLINVARGGVVDQTALLGALDSGDIGGASLDVTDPEPLPDDSPLWRHPKCVITSHDAGYSPLAGQRLGSLFLENLAAYLADAPLRNEASI